jgi:hypothetical protein
MVQGGGGLTLKARHALGGRLPLDVRHVGGDGLGPRGVAAGPRTDGPPGDPGAAERLALPCGRILFGPDSRAADALAVSVVVAPAVRAWIRTRPYPSASASSSKARMLKARMLAMRSVLPVSSVITLENPAPVTAMQVCPDLSP